MFVSLHQQNPPRFPMNSEPGRNFYFMPNAMGFTKNWEQEPLWDTSL